MNMPSRALAGILTVTAAAAGAAELLLPQERAVFFSGEEVELAVAGVGAGTPARVLIAPAATNEPVRPVEWRLTGNGGTQSAAWPGGSLAPGRYTASLEGGAPLSFQVISGVRPSPLLVSQTSTRPPAGGAGFHVANAFSFGLLDGDGQPLRDVRGRKSPGMAGIEGMAASGYPAVCYMYWTGFVTHKPFGSEKSWANDAMQEAMRLLSFSVGQRMRRYAPLWEAVGPIDEPGLAWGRTPAGGMASGFPNWDEQPWYQQRGWTFTPDIAAQSDKDWLRYLRIRCDIIGESYRQARQDLRAAWPSAVFGGDLYALHAVMDGTDGLNQEANDAVTTHVFFDFFGGPMSVPGQLYLDKCHRPSARVSHAMNGQLTGVKGPQRPLYHWLMNGMLQAGLAGNWWLNTGGMTEADLRAVNTPVAELGPLFLQFEPVGHDIAILWGWTEHALRQKAMAALESKRKDGQQITLMVPLPERAADAPASVTANAYEVGQTYAMAVLGLHQAVRRAGYAAHILHESLLERGSLKDYRVLCIVSQTGPLPGPAQAAVEAFQAAGGIVLTDRPSLPFIPGGRVMDADLSADAVRRLTVEARRQAASAPSPAAAAQFESNRHQDEAWRRLAGPVKQALRGTPARPVVTTDSLDLSVERHVRGRAQLVMVLNGSENTATNVIPLPRYNPAPATHTFTLQGVPRRSTVWCIEGLDWKRVTAVDRPERPITASFEAGEMKLYLVVPDRLDGLRLDARAANHGMHIDVSLKGLSAPWPLVLTVAGPHGAPAYRLQRAADGNGALHESIPLGANALPGDWQVRVEDPLTGRSARQTVAVSGSPTDPRPVTDAVRILDETPLRAFLASRPELTIALGDDASQRPAAERLKAALASKGLAVTIRPEGDLLKKVPYPRVLNPSVPVYYRDGSDRSPAGEVTSTMTADLQHPVDLRKPLTVVTIGEEGYLHWEGQDREVAFQPGVKLYVDANRSWTVLNGSATNTAADAAFRARWCRPWTRLTSHPGAFQLPPCLPEAYEAAGHLVVLGDSRSSRIAAALQASEILERVVDERYPGPGKALVQFARSPFGVGRDVVFIGASDAAGLGAGGDAVVSRVP